MVSWVWSLTSSDLRVIMLRAKNAIPLLPLIGFFLLSLSYPIVYTDDISVSKTKVMMMRLFDQSVTDSVNGADSLRMADSSSSRRPHLSSVDFYFWHVPRTTTDSKDVKEEGRR